MTAHSVSSLLRRRNPGSERSSEDGLASGSASADYGSHERNELFKGARAVGPDGKPRARTAAEIKAAYGHRTCETAAAKRVCAACVIWHLCGWSPGAVITQSDHAGQGRRDFYACSTVERPFHVTAGARKTGP